MYAVAADEREESREETAAGGSVAGSDQRAELRAFQQQKRETENSRGRQGRLGEKLVSLRYGDGRQPAEEARAEKAGGLPSHAVKIIDLARVRSTGGRTGENGVCREQAGEDDDVRQQEEPEAVAHDDALAGRPAAAVAAREIGAA